MPDDLSTALQSLRLDRAPARSAKRASAIAVGTAALLLVTTAGGTIAYRRLESRIFKTPVRLSSVASVSRAEGGITVAASGYVIAERTAKIGAKRAGRLATVRVREGDLVKKGALLATLEDADSRASLRSADAHVTAASARLLQARAMEAQCADERARTETLVENEAVAGSALVDVRHKCDGLEAGVAAAESDERVAVADAEAQRERVADGWIVAPFQGTVVGRPLAVGDLVGPNGAALLELVDTTTLVVDCDLPEVRLHSVQVGDRCEVVLDAYPSRHLPGTVVGFAGRVDRAKATLRAKVRLDDNPASMVPDMAARVQFFADAASLAQASEPPVLVVAKSAVVRDHDRAFVYLAEGDHARRTAVTLGPERGSTYELMKGPPSGAKVVDAPPEDLIDDSLIRERAE